MVTEQQLDDFAAKRDAERRALGDPPLPVCPVIAVCVRELSAALDRWLVKPQPANHHDLALRAGVHAWCRSAGVQ